MVYQEVQVEEVVLEMMDQLELVVQETHQAHLQAKEIMVEQQNPLMQVQVQEVEEVQEMPLQEKMVVMEQLLQ
jgi:hypothetical protein